MEAALGTRVGRSSRRCAGPGLLTYPTRACKSPNAGTGRNLWLAAIVFALAFPFNTEDALSHALRTHASLDHYCCDPVEAGALCLGGPPARSSLSRPLISNSKLPVAGVSKRFQFAPPCRLEPEEAYLRRRMSNYDMARFIDERCPAERTGPWALDTVTEAYNNRTVSCFTTNLPRVNWSMRFC